jgi:hypothetical protein
MFFLEFGSECAVNGCELMFFDCKYSGNLLV